MSEIQSQPINEKIESLGIAVSLDRAAAELLIAYRALNPFGKMIVRETAVMLERHATKSEYGAFVASLMDAEEFPVYRLLLVNTRENWPVGDPDNDRQTTARAVLSLAGMIDRKGGEAA